MHAEYWPFTVSAIRMAFWPSSEIDVSDRFPLGAIHSGRV